MLPTHLKYVFLEGKLNKLIIISNSLSKMLESHNEIFSFRQKPKGGRG